MFALIVFLTIGGRPAATSVVPYFTTKAYCEAALADVEKLATTEMWPGRSKALCVRTGDVPMSP